MKKQVSVQVPASSGNIGPGFDVAGLALSFGNELKVRVLGQKSAKPILHVFGEGQDSLPTDARNIIFKAIKAVFSKAKKKVPKLEIVCLNRIPLARGLGSSASAVLSGLLAANKLLNNRFSKEEILSLATEFEGHPDNVAPALLGGVQVSGLINGKVVTHAWPVPKLNVVVAVPNFQLSTKKARSVLPKKISLKDAIWNLSAVSLLPKAFSGDHDLLSFLLNDRWHEPYRSRLIPGFSKVKKAALKAGALGVTLSGAGPTMLSFVEPKKASRVASVMHKIFKQAGIQNRVMELKIDSKGASVK